MNIRMIDIVLVLFVLTNIALTWFTQGNIPALINFILWVAVLFLVNIWSKQKC